MNDFCISCGAAVKNGFLCRKCAESKDNSIPEELRQIAAVLKITEPTDANIRESVEEILNIAERLEGKTKGLNVNIAKI